MLIKQQVIVGHGRDLTVHGDVVAVYQVLGGDQNRGLGEQKLGAPIGNLHAMLGG